MTHTYFFKSQELRKYMIRCFTQWEVPQSDAQIAAEILLSADKRGVDSHGIIRLFSYYGSRLKKGLIDPKSPMTVLRETLTTVALDGGNGLGHPVSYKAMQMVIDKAKENSTAFATVRNSNHFGIAGYYAMMALPHNMIGVCYTNSSPLVAPTHGRKAMLGTNPISVAVPARNELPFVLDMATSIVPKGRVAVYQKQHRPIPLGWGIDDQGNATENPEDVLDGGSLLPLGGSEITRGYKGYGLG
ncbi:Ldh family oxidoreductase, partial [bacterium]|nr:Ldh family oxidoreductase [bacterium]